MTARENWATPDDLARLKGDAQARAIGRQKRRNEQPERYFTDGIKRFAIRGGWLVYHTLHAKGSDPGFPDLIMIRGNRLVIAELKVPRRGRRTADPPSDWQACWLTAFRILALVAGPLLSIEVFIWTPSDWPAIEQVLT